MAIIKDGHIILRVRGDEGCELARLQRSLIIALECVATSRYESDDYKQAVYDLTELLQVSMLDDSQTNIALGKKPYRPSR